MYRAFEFQQAFDDKQPVVSDPERNEVKAAFTGLVVDALLDNRAGVQSFPQDNTDLLSLQKPAGEGSTLSVGVSRSIRDSGAVVTQVSVQRMQGGRGHELSIYEKDEKTGDVVRFDMERLPELLARRDSAQPVGLVEIGKLGEIIESAEPRKMQY